MTELSTPSSAVDRLSDDATLLRRAVAGDHRAFADLYDRHAAPAYAAARRLLGPTPAAEDVVQEAMLQLWRTGGSYAPERGSLRAWLVVLVRSRAIDLIRHEHVRAAAAERAGDDQHRRPAPDVAMDEHLRRERAQELHSVIVRLPPEQAQVVGLQYLVGRSQADIARHLDVPLGTVKGRARLALSKLRRELEPAVAQA